VKGFGLRSKYPITVGSGQQLKIALVMVGLIWVLDQMGQIKPTGYPGGYIMELYLKTFVFFTHAITHLVLDPTIYFLVVKKITR
jgi:hypothetical protein